MLKCWDARRDLCLPGDEKATLTFAVEQLIAIAKEAIADHDAFYIALSGGSTPKTIFERLCLPPYQGQIAWEKWHLFWSDERSVPPEHPDSNYRMAMEAGFKKMPIPTSQIHRMKAEEEIEKNAFLYQQTIEKVLQGRGEGRGFDLMMLGMGDDGHTASLFPHTDALEVVDQLVVANFVPQHQTWRMTLTYDCINQSNHIVIYVLGAKKRDMLQRVLTSPDNFAELPSQKVGTLTHKALWIADTQAAEGLIK